MTPDISLVFRTVKGSPLTAAEVDQNFSKIRDAIIAVAQQYKFRLVIGDEPPVGDREGVLWIPSSHNGIFVWNSTSGAWDQVTEPALYAEATNVGNDYSITIPGSFASITDLKGRVIAFRTSLVNGANSGGCTLKVNAFTSQPLTKVGSTALITGEIKSGAVYLACYDGAEFQLLNPTPIPVIIPPIPVVPEPPQYFISELIDIPYSGFAQVSYPLTTKPALVRLAAVVYASPTSGYVDGDEVDALSFESVDGSAVGTLRTFSVSVNHDDKTITVSLGPFGFAGTFSTFYPAKSGGRASMPTSQLQMCFKLRVYALSFPSTVT